MIVEKKIWKIKVKSEVRFSEFFDFVKKSDNLVVRIMFVCDWIEFVKW